MLNLNDNERVREHLANERTYLAWLRTGIATMGFGVVITKLRYLFSPSGMMPESSGLIHASHIGMILAIIGLILIIISAWRFAIIQSQIRQGKYQSSKKIIIALSSAVIILGLFIIVYLLQSALPDFGFSN